MDLIRYKNLELVIPIKSIPDEKLNSIIINDFIVWLSDLLSLTDEVSGKRLEIALPAIKEHCWSMGFDEITKMFKMYADNKLSIEPIPNYFDRILFGKIVKAYKDSKPIVKKEIPAVELSQEEKDNIIYLGVINCFDEFSQNNEISNGYVWVYDHLDEINILSYSDEDKRKQMPIAKNKLILENKNILSYKDYESFKHNLENKRAERAIINQAKKMLLERYFSKLIAKGKHIKELI